MKITTTASLTVRTNFAGNHLRASVRAAREAFAIEQANDTSKLNVWFDDIVMLVPVSIVMAGAALEANANELIEDVLSSRTLSDAKKALLRGARDDRSGNSLDKYLQLALLLDKVPDKGKPPSQDAALLVQFRNYFLHFRPEFRSDGDAADDRNLVKSLRAKFPVAAPFERSVFLFPHALLTYRVAKWSVQSVLAFSSYVSTLLDTNDRFDAWKAQFELIDS
jgi:hypothetical protein